ncbi:MAG: 3'-5' exonuclease, partial [Candidatus Binatia bacterium]
DDGVDVDFVLWTSDADDDDPDAVEGAGLADWIAAHLRTRREHGETGDPHSVPVVVLVRGRAHALPLLRALENRAPEVRVRAPGLDHLGDRITAIDLEALTRALVHPGDRMSWLALLRSAWIGLSLGDIAALVETDVAEAGASRARAIPLLLGDDTALARLSDDGRARAARLAAILGAARNELATRSIDVVVRTAWLRLGGLTAVPERLGLEALDAEAFFDLLAARVRDGRVDLDDLARTMREAEAPVDADAEVDLEIMTMHKAKGLEFDTVILPALGRRAGRSDSLPLAMETRPDSGRLTLVTPRGARGRDDADGDKYDFLQHREQHRQNAETLRLLYVAATRTKCCLLLSAAAGTLNKDGSAPAGSLLRAFAPAVDVDDARRCTVVMAAPAAKRSMTRFPAAFSLVAAPPSVADRSVVSVSPSTIEQPAPEFFADGKLAARIGTVYHSFVERIAADGPSAWPAHRVETERAAIEHELRTEGVLPGEMGQAAARVAAALEATLRDERGVWMLSAHDSARSERAMTAWRSGRMISAKLDRTFDADGACWVVDFKTGTWNPEAGEEAEARYVLRKREQYAAQLASYRDLVRGAPGGDRLPVRLALYFAEWPEGRRWQDITELADAATASPEP